MQKIFIYSLLIAGFGLACSPKKGGQMAETDHKSKPAKGNAPAIPLPTGDVRKAAPKPGEAPKIQIGDADQFVLENGLKVILVQNHKLPQINFQIFVDADPTPEGDAVGYQSMSGDLLAMGTRSRTKADIDKQIDFIGARMGSSRSGVTGSSLTRHSEKLLEIMSDVLLNPAFPPSELDKLLKQTETSIQSEKDDPNSIAGNVADVLRYGKTHPYGEVMTTESIKKINIDLCKKYYETWFKPNISYLIITGDISREKAEKYAKKYFGTWKQGPTPKQDIGEPRAPEATTVNMVHKPGAVQSVLRVTYPVSLRPGEIEGIKASVLNTVLGGYFNSRLNANLREGHGWTYGIGSSLNPDKHIGYFSIGSSVRNEVTDSAITEVLKEMNRLRNEKLDAKELSVVKNVMTGNFGSSLEQPGTLASFALNMSRFSLPKDYYQKYLEVLNSVTPEEIQNLAKKYLRPDRAHILVVGNKDDVAEKLKSFAPDGKVNFYDTDGNPAKQVSVALPAGMTGEKVINDYITAIGGMGKISAIKDMTTESVIKSGGPEFKIMSFQKYPGKFKFEMTMNGQLLVRQVTDGVAGKMEGMQGSQELQGPELEDLKSQADMFKEAYYSTKGFALNLKGIEVIDAKNAYVVEVTDKNGEKWTEYYDMSSSLKMREVTVQDQGGQTATVQTDFSDYKAVNEVLFPHTLDLIGVFPVPMKSKMVDVKVNTNIDDSIFKVK